MFQSYVTSETKDIWNYFSPQQLNDVIMRISKTA